MSTPAGARCSSRCRSSRATASSSALLVDLVARFGLDAVAQVDLDVREHRNRPLDELGPQAMAVLVTGLRRAGIARRQARAA